MTEHDKPSIGNWYQGRASGDVFEVTGVNSDEERVELRYLDRRQETLDFDSWRSLDPVQVEAPNSGPTDNARAPSAPSPTSGR
jgi:hypothetical protein